MNLFKGKYYKILLFSFFLQIFIIFSFQTLSAQNAPDENDKINETEKKSEKDTEDMDENEYEEFITKYHRRQKASRAALLGIIPGLGQFSNGNYLSGAVQTASFLTFLDLAGKNASKGEYIRDEDRLVEFNFFHMFLAEEFQKNNLLYQDFPFLTETRWDRDLRMWKDQKLAELNPLLQYGSYYRMNYASANVDLASQSAMHTTFYSIYSAYRDAGGISDSRKDETFLNLAAAPFRPKYLMDPHVFIPLAILLGAFATTPASGPYTLVSPGMKSSGYLGFYVTTISFNAGVGEEAFFRGYLNHSISSNYSPMTGGLISGTLFGLAHLGNGKSLGDVIPQTLFGYYFAYMHYKNNYDIGPGIALHFWWDLIIFGFSLARYKEDRNVDKNEAQVHYMPTLFQMRF